MGGSVPYFELASAFGCGVTVRMRIFAKYFVIGLCETPHELTCTLTVKSSKFEVIWDRGRRKVRIIRGKYIAQK